jgi:uroporphyrinogen-III synthase
MLIPLACKAFEPLNTDDAGTVPKGFNQIEQYFFTTASHGGGSANTVDIITFASSKTVLFFSQLTAHIFTYNPENLARVCIASIGPQTSKTCQTVFGRVDIEAEEYTLEGLTNAIIKWTNHS